MQNISIYIEAFSGLGLFMFGMMYLESQIKASAGKSFKNLVQRATYTKFKSLSTGIGATALMQSSSVVTLMALSLVGAGLMSLQSSIAIIFGSNIGTTMTAWIVAIIGFSMDIELMSYVVIGVGGLGQVLTSETSKYKNYFGVLVGFGLIFLGLEGMKGSFAGVAETFDISAYSSLSPYWFVVLGFALTAIIQSSSATIAIAQSALYSNLIPFETAAAFVIGANIGTTATAILGAIGGIPDKKRVALAHFFFNFTTGLVALIILHPLVELVEYLFSGVVNSVVQIAIFHTIFNALGVILWYPFIETLTRFIQKFFKKEKEHVTKYIAHVPISVPEIAIEALDKEIKYLTFKVEEFALLAVNVPPPKVLEEHMSIDKILDRYQDNFNIMYEKMYNTIRELEGELYKYSASLSTLNQDTQYTQLLSERINTIHYLATAAKIVKDILYDLDIFYESTTKEEQEFYRNMRYQIIKTVAIFHKGKSGDITSLNKMEELYKKVVDSYKKSTDILEKIIQNSTVSSDTVTMAINDLHALKNFSKAMKKVLGQNS